jgi:hypothetical protein
MVRDAVDEIFKAGYVQRRDGKKHEILSDCRPWQNLLLLTVLGCHHKAILAVLTAIFGGHRKAVAVARPWLP